MWMSNCSRPSAPPSRPRPTPSSPRRRPPPISATTPWPGASPSPAAAGNHAGPAVAGAVGRGRRCPRLAVGHPAPRRRPRGPARAWPSSFSTWAAPCNARATAPPAWKLPGCWPSAIAPCPTTARSPPPNWSAWSAASTTTCASSPRSTSTSLLLSMSAPWLRRGVQPARRPRAISTTTGRWPRKATPTSWTTPRSTSACGTWRTASS